MSATPSPNVERTIERCRPEDLTPVGLDADVLESTAPEYLRDLKRELNEHGFVPASLTVPACFDADCSLRTQDEVEYVRAYIRAAAFLGVGTLTVQVDDVHDEDKARPALEACAERARREGVHLTVDGPISL